MMDILICRLKYPNDPRGRVLVHQHFVGLIAEDRVELYSISSFRGKEYRVFDKRGRIRDEYFLIKGENQVQMSLRMPSFIDCSKAYQLELAPSLDLEKLANRKIPGNIRNEILGKIKSMKDQGKHKTYKVDLEDFLDNNPKSRV